MSVQTICAVITCAFVIGGVLIFIGRSLGTLQKIEEGLQVVFPKVDRLETDMARIDKELTEVRTRQEDCEKCP